MSSTDHESLENIGSDLSSGEKQFVTFSLEGEEYGIPILAVQGIESVPHVTHLPGVPAYVKGIINLRGIVIPLIDLRAKFSLPGKDSAHPVAIIINSEGKNTHYGIIVDAVSDVMGFTANEIQEMPAVAEKTSVIEKIGKKNNKLVMILNISLLVSSDDTIILDNALKRSSAA
ncbi:MAG: hypothetical protein A2096_16530 [Spirochaetes bacterium GWF1_41_5]|nr:MAG: hypothetical protein A2096_16530 [Spirochaetes bacterium GWF1_41_5]